MDRWDVSGVDADYGIFELLDRNGSIDAQLVTSTTVRGPASPGPVERSAGTTGEGSKESRSAAREPIAGRLQGGASLDDRRCRARSMPVAAALAAGSDITLLVMQLIIKDIRVAHSMLQALTCAGRVHGVDAIGDQPLPPSRRVHHVERGAGRDETGALGGAHVSVQ